MQQACVLLYELLAKCSAGVVVSFSCLTSLDTWDMWRPPFMMLTEMPWTWELCSSKVMLE